MKKHLYKFLSALFVVGMLTISASATAGSGTYSPVTPASLKSFDCTALLNQMFSIQPGSNCGIKLSENLGKDLKAATSPSTGMDFGKVLSATKDCNKIFGTTLDWSKILGSTKDCTQTPSTGGDCSETPCAGNDCNQTPCVGNDCNQTPCIGKDCSQTPCDGNDCSETPCVGNDCPSTPCTGGDCSEPPVVTPPVTEPPVVTPPVTEPPVVTPPVTEPPVVTPPVTETPSGISAYEMEVINLVNEIRISNGLNALTPSAKLSEVARTKSQDMRTNGYFAHQSPTYGSPFDMLRQFGVTYRTAGENIAYGYSTPAAVVEGWMNSQGHRENILKSTYTEIGVGYVASGHYWTQLFTG